MLIRDVGEFALIDRLAARIGASAEAVQVGIGDDAAVIATGARNDLILTTDTMVEGVHFRLDFASPRQVGWKALASAVSDVAAMGGTPTAVIVSLAVNGHVAVDVVDDLYDGLAACANRHDTEIVGGDTVHTDGPMVVTVSVVGECQAGRAVTRAGAQPGDAVVVTGTPGDSGAGLALLAAGKGNDPRFAALVKRHLQPTARIFEGATLADHGATAIIDISDGLMQDAGHIARRSGVGIQIRLDRIPTSDPLRSAGDALGVDPTGWILAGGEDYELLATMVPSATGDVAAKMETSGCVAIAVIGVVVEGQGVTVVDADENPLEASPGWEHFSASG